MAGTKIIDGTPVNAATTNDALLGRHADDTVTGVIAFENVNVESGGGIDNPQQEWNALDFFVGKDPNTPINTPPAWVENNGLSPTDRLFQRSDTLSGKFNAATGHTHTGAAGDAPQIDSGDISSVRLHGYFTRGVDITGASGGFTDVTSQFSLSTPSSSPTVEGIVVNLPYNKIILRQATGVDAGDPFLDAFGNEVYGRITESTGTWTITYYVLISTTETPYSFPSPVNVAFYYQSLFNVITDAPVYSELAYLPSENLTETVVDATFTQAGKVSTLTQGFGGQKIFLNGIAYVLTADNTTTGASASFPAATSNWIELQNAGLISIAGLAIPMSGEIRIVTNATGGDVIFLFDLGSPSTNGILSAGGENVTLPDSGSLFFAYDTIVSRWRIIGGSGSGGGRFVTSATQTINGTAITITDNDGFQMVRVKGASGGASINSTPFGTVAADDGTVVRVIGQDDTDYLMFFFNDASFGALTNGNCTLGKNDVIEFIYDATLNRWVESFRSGA